MLRRRFASSLSAVAPSVARRARSHMTCAPAPRGPAPRRYPNRPSHPLPSQLLLPVSPRDFRSVSYPMLTFATAVHGSTQAPDELSSTGVDPSIDMDSIDRPPQNRIRLSKLVSSYGKNITMSRRSAESLIKNGQVTVAGAIITSPSHMMTLDEASAGGGVIKVSGRRLLFDASSTADGPSSAGFTRGECSDRTRVWLVHKLPGEIVAENDPGGRPSLLERLRRGGVGKPRRRSQKPVHLKPVGRLDMMTEGLIVVTNDGRYARDMELPSNKLHRTYRARVHGRITPGKLSKIRSGLLIENVRYRGMTVNLELGGKSGSRRRREGSTNTWLRITCEEGKNRQIRRILDHLGLNVTRLIRCSFGDYALNTIPPGMAIEVPVKPIESQRRRGALSDKSGREVYSHGTRKHPTKSHKNPVEDEGNEPVEWIRHI